MRRRPWPIVIFALFQIVVEPITNVLLNAAWSDLTPAAYLRWYAEQRDWLSLFYVIGLPVVMGLSVYAMKRWSYGLFLACSAWVTYREYLLAEGNQLPMQLLLLLSLANLAFVSYFLLPWVFAPYLDSRLRWWEAKPRFSVSYRGLMAPTESEPLEGQVENLSAGGVFLVLPATAALLGRNTHCRLELVLAADQRLQVCARIAFRRPMPSGGIGYGLEFQDLSRESRQVLAHLLRRLNREGAAINRHGGAWADFRNWAWRLIRTGQGLLPETGVVAASRPQSSGDSKVATSAAADATQDLKRAS